VRALPDGLRIDDVLAALATCYGLAASRAEYAPVGGGSYHWVVSDDVGAVVFVTVDDLAHKGWLGDSNDDVLAGLRSAFETAVRLREAGLEFVVAPLRAGDGDVVQRVDERYTVAVFPFVDGVAGRFGAREEGERADVTAMLVELHRRTATVRSHARPVGLDLPGRDRIERALADAAGSWQGGPLSEAARALVSHGAGRVSELLALADRLVARVEVREATWVVTHGEPHPGNVLDTRAGRMLVDWDTVGLAPPERDLWFVATTASDDRARVYAEATGRAVDEDALDFFRLTWDLKDLAEYLHLLRSPHTENEDSLRALEGVAGCIAVHDVWADRIGEVDR
jgi:spectinomycin phosphotransferase